MRVLVLTPLSPVPANWGGALRMLHVIRQLSLRYEVTVIGNGTPETAALLRREVPRLADVQLLPIPWPERYRRLGQLWSTVRPRSHAQMAFALGGVQEALLRAHARTPFDVVHTEFSHFGPFQLPADALRVVDSHNVEHELYARMARTVPSRLRRAFYAAEARKLRQDEVDTIGTHQVLLATSDFDRELFGRTVPGVPCHVVPNGVDTGFFHPGAEADVEPDSLVFTGMMQYLPNSDGATWFLDEVLPRVHARVPTAKVYLVGKNPPPELAARAGDRVVVTGTVPDVRPYVQRAAVSIVPLRMGGGTRLKIVEALAMGRPVVSTQVGAEGIDVVHGQSALLTPTEPGPFADAVVAALQDAALRRRLGEAGLTLARECYDWAAIGARLEAVYREHLGSGARRRAAS